MKTKPDRESNDSSNGPGALARKVLDQIKVIEKEAQAQRLAQLDTLRTAREAILHRLAELQHQISQIDAAMTAITGRQEAAPRQGRRNYDPDRERIGAWLEGRPGEKFGAGDLVKEFPELAGATISYVMKPLVEAGRVRTDLSAGVRRAKYYAACGA